MLLQCRTAWNSVWLCFMHWRIFSFCRKFIYLFKQAGRFIYYTTQADLFRISTSWTVLWQSCLCKDRVMLCASIMCIIWVLMMMCCYLQSSILHLITWWHISLVFKLVLIISADCITRKHLRSESVPKFCNLWWLILSVDGV